MTRDFDDWDSKNRIINFIDPDTINTATKKDFKDLEKRIADIEKQVKEFDKWRDTKPLESYLKELVKSYDNLNHKVRELEHWRNNPPTRLSELEQQMKEFKSFRTEWINNEWYNRLIKLEQNEKAYHESSMTAWNNKHEDRILKLEEWKQDICSWGDQKVIDKQVWEDIKRFTESVYRLKYTKDFENQLSYLIHVIKKVEPEWEPEK